MLGLIDKINRLKSGKGAIWHAPKKSEFSEDLRKEELTDSDSGGETLQREGSTPQQQN